MGNYEPSKSKAIQDEVDRWVAAGRKSAIRKKADHIISGRSWWWTYCGMEVMVNALQKKSQPVPVVWSAVIKGSLDATLLFFEETEEGVLARFGVLKPKSSPRNTLVKNGCFEAS